MLKQSMLMEADEVCAESVLVLVVSQLAGSITEECE